VSKSSINAVYMEKDDVKQRKSNAQMPNILQKKLAKAILV
jgi:hypothetical protein